MIVWSEFVAAVYDRRRSAGHAGDHRPPLQAGGYPKTAGLVGRGVPAEPRLTGDGSPYPRGGNRDSGSRIASRAFTLIELMVVIGVIIIVLGAVGLAVAGRGGEGAALVNAQSIVSSLVSSTRAQAVLHQTNARLIVYAQMPPATNVDSYKYLRSLQVVRLDTLANGSTAWVAAGEFVTLPEPICIVPPSPVPTNHLRLPTGQSWNNNALTGPVSTLTTLTGFSYRGQTNATTQQFFGVQGQSGRIHYLEFAPDGTVVSNTSSNPTKIAMATAILAANTIPLFNNASGVRGLFVRKSGAVSLVDDATGF